MKTKIEILTQENLDLKKRNSELSRMLLVAKNWMEKQIKEEITKISRKNIKKLSEETKVSFIS